MKKVILYLIVCLASVGVVVVSWHIWKMPAWLTENLLFVRCSILGCVGGILYSLRAVYLNRCVRKAWDKDWEVWYYLRPVTSTLSGFASCIFLKAGLLVLDAQAQSNGYIFGYLAVAFVAGYNVDNFLKKIEAVACEVWGVNKSRAAEDIRPGEKRGEAKEE